ncbi:hypothetical protein [Streptomyces sp. NPDC001165]|uniref:hypothetical protein n=1 Tax=Streptomyces sp. NPDC001165 TaxID=3364546 RepID=UPI0036C4D491
MMIVDGGNPVAEAVKAVFRDSRAIYMGLLTGADGEEASTLYDMAIRSYWDSVNAMVWEMHYEANRDRADSSLRRATVHRPWRRLSRDS